MKHTKGNCPKCGKPFLEMDEYANGDKCYTHKKELVANLYYRVTEHCYIKLIKKATL